ncbi:fungal-specific transcription factor domain-containing protein [Aspergillus carlsbadensis]|nr:fungal-specific transcription factor domain-containing protein [Aspergillus carlsbadensis]
MIRREGNSGPPEAVSQNGSLFRWDVLPHDQDYFLNHPTIKRRHRTPTSAAMASRTPKRVFRACQRCQRQKLKCDTQRPCTLCARTGVECVPVTTERWKAYAPSPRPSAAASNAHDGTRRRRPRDPSELRQRRRADNSLGHELIDAAHEDNDALQPTGSVSEEQLGGSSSTMSLVDGAFRLYNAPTPEIPSASAIPGGGRESARAAKTARDRDRPAPRNRRLLAAQPAVRELMLLLPGYDVAKLLVNTYFDCVHWFVLLFHQDDFRRRWQLLYEDRPANRRSQRETNVDSQDLGFIGSFLMVIAIGIEYAGVHRKQLLEAMQVDYRTLKSKVLKAIRSQLLDIVAWGSLESAQTCVLLGTYYLFHGDPGVAWPVCGCALRTALALGLHRKQHPPQNVSEQALPGWRNRNEARKRCWWAIYEIETFCSMSYGYPHSIADTDWDAEPLDPSAKCQPRSSVPSPASFEQPLLCEPTLLTYKYLMSKLSVIIQQVLAQLYRIGSTTGLNEVSESFSSPSMLVERVANLNQMLIHWKQEIPASLKVYWAVPLDSCYTSPEQLDRDVGASGPRFESHIFQLQAVTLHLAYENARILIHRPLLSIRFKSHANVLNNAQPDRGNEGPLIHALHICRDAAITTSRLISAPIMSLAAETYAAAFIGIHTFTAALTLSILFSTDPLSSQSHEIKLGLQRLMAVQQKLRVHSPLSAQGLEILKQLVRHAMEKEWGALLDGSQLVSQDQLVNPVLSAGAMAPPPVLSNEFSHDMLGFPSGDTSSAPVADPTAGDQHIPIDRQEYIPDPTLLEAIADVDRAILGSYSSEPLAQESPSGLAWSLSDQLAFPEQAWIWSLDAVDYSQCL